MTNSIYKINKGINKPIEFKGLKAQYIGWLGGGVVALLLLFVLLYLTGVNSFICLGIIAVLGVFLFLRVFKMSHDYGEHGMKKKMAARLIPDVVKSNSRKIFMFYGTKL
jgi:hypothetical protein